MADSEPNQPIETEKTSDSEANHLAELEKTSDSEANQSAELEKTSDSEANQSAELEKSTEPEAEKPTKLEDEQPTEPVKTLESETEQPTKTENTEEIETEQPKQTENTEKSKNEQPTKTEKIEESETEQPIKTEKTTESEAKQTTEIENTEESETEQSTKIENTVEPKAKQPTEIVQDNEKELRYLDFVQSVAFYAIACFSILYEYAKENSGPLKPGVETVEGTVKTVIGPVYEKFHDVPFDLLKFIDHEVDESLNEVDHRVPPLLKQTLRQTFLVVQKSVEVARVVALEVQKDGVVNTATNIAKTLYTKYEPTAKELYSTYEPVAEQYTVSVWRSLNQLPLFPEVAHIVVPTAAYWSEKYNQAVTFLAQRGYMVSYYLPLVPIERIAKVFEGAENGTNGADAVVLAY